MERSSFKLMKDSKKPIISIATHAKTNCNVLIDTGAGICAWVDVWSIR